MAFKAIDNRERLDVLLGNMGELQIDNMLEVLDIYITIRSLGEIQERMTTPQLDRDLTHEFKMRGIVDFRDMLSSLLKSR